MNSAHSWEPLFSSWSCWFTCNYTMQLPKTDSVFRLWKRFNASVIFGDFLLKKKKINSQDSLNRKSITDCITPTQTSKQAALAVIEFWGPHDFSINDKWKGDRQPQRPRMSDGQIYNKKKLQNKKTPKPTHNSVKTCVWHVLHIFSQMITSRKHNGNNNYMYNLAN